MPSWKKVIISGSNAALNSLNVSTSLTASGIIYPTTDGTSGQVVITDGNGNLSFSNIENTTISIKNMSGGTIAKGTPCYITGSGTSGNLAGVWPADASNPLRMPAGVIAGETLTAGAEGIGLINGFISGVNTSAFAAGDSVYVAVGGGYTNVKPTGSSVLIQKLGNVEKSHVSNGSGVINGPGYYNEVPNIQQGYTWVGNGNGVATPVATSSIQNVVSSSFATSASFASTASWATNVVNNGVTSVATAGTVSGITLTGGTITSTGTITLGGSISGLTNSNLSGTAGITNANLANPSLMIGNSSIALGATGSSLTGLTSVTSTSFTGSLFGTASWANNAVNASTATVATRTVQENTGGSGNYYMMMSDGTVGTNGRTYNTSNLGYPLYYNASTDTLYAKYFNGAFVGNASTANSAATLTTARNINGTSFNGSADITTANWGTTRTITIGSTGKSVNGSGNVSWSLAEIGAQAALTNPVTGTGVDNRIAVWSGTTTQDSDSNLTWNGTTFNVGGTLTATVKSFIIDHPTKQGKKLQYGVLEGPEHSVYVRGKLTNNNTITLPDHWHALVHEDTITVNLTPIGKKQDLWVETVSDTAITVGSDNEINCFYTVFAERKDIEKLVTEFDKE